MSRNHSLALVVALATNGLASADVFSGAGGPLIDAVFVPPSTTTSGVATFQLTVPNEGTVGAFNGVTLSGLSHTWIGDLRITLTAPDGTTVSLVDRVGFPIAGSGDSSNFLGDYAFADGGADLWTLATLPSNGNGYNLPSGKYAATGGGSGAPIGLASQLQGRSIAGTWTLTISDFAAADSGAVVMWQIDVDVESATSGVELLTMTSAGVLGDTDATAAFPDTTDDGRYVLLSVSSDLLSGPTPTNQDLMLKDRITGELELVSVNSDEVPANGISSLGVVSGDGRFVVFVSTATNLAPGSSGLENVYLRDRVTGTTERIGQAFDGGWPNAPCFLPDVSDDGRYVSFTSAASNILRGVPILTYQVYRVDRQTNATKLISAPFGQPITEQWGSAEMTPDGGEIVFNSLDDTLVPGDSNGQGDVFVVDTETLAIERISLTSDEQPALGGASNGGRISADGNRVAFLSLSPSFSPDFNGFRQAYVRDRAAGTTTLVSVTELGDLAPGEVGSLSLSGDGQYVALRCRGSLVADDENTSDDVYRIGVGTGEVSLLSRSVVDGKATGSSTFSAINLDGTVVAFRSTAPDLVTYDTNGVADIFAAELVVAVIGDLDRDGTVTGADLAILLGGWGGDGAADLNGDGTVDGADLAILLGAWGS